MDGVVLLMGNHCKRNGVFTCQKIEKVYTAKIGAGLPTFPPENVESSHVAYHNILYT